MFAWPISSPYKISYLLLQATGKHPKHYDEPKNCKVSCMSQLDDHAFDIPKSIKVTRITFIGVHLLYILARHNCSVTDFCVFCDQLPTALFFFAAVEGRCCTYRTRGGPSQVQGAQ